MDLVTNLVVLIIFGLLSFVIEMIWGVNPYHAYTAIGTITLVGSLLYIMGPSLANAGDINAFTLSITRLTNWLVDFLPGALIGNVAGSLLAKITGDRRYA